MPLCLLSPQLLQGLQKKGVAPEEMARKGAAISSRQERLLLLLNLLNAGGSLVLPCWLVLSNQVKRHQSCSLCYMCLSLRSVVSAAAAALLVPVKEVQETRSENHTETCLLTCMFVACCAAQSSLVPAFVLTVVAIVLSMKLATYAHCNTTLRAEARARAVAAAAANYPVPSTPLLPTTPLQPASFSSGTGSGLWSRARGGLATATTHTPAACTAGYGSGDNVPALRSSATDPHPFLMAGLRRTNSTLRRQAAAGVVVVRDVVYPANLVPSDLAYFLAAPSLTYQLNFPRLRQRRWRLLSRWLLLAVLTAIAMSFMQVGGAWCVLCWRGCVGVCLPSSKHNPMASSLGGCCQGVSAPASALRRSQPLPARLLPPSSLVQPFNTTVSCCLF